MDISDVGYVIVMALWAALVVLLSYQLGYDNGRWAWIEERESERVNSTKANGGSEGTRNKSETLK